MQTFQVHEGTKSRNILKRNRQEQYNRIKSPLCNQALHHLQMHKLQTLSRKKNALGLSREMAHVLAHT